VIFQFVHTFAILFMPKTDINTILKNGSATQIKTVDYSSTEKKEHLKKLKEKSETALQNKEVSIQKLSRFVIKK
jgi:hypothetical protein